MTDMERSQIAQDGFSFQITPKEPAMPRVQAPQRPMQLRTSVLHFQEIGDGTLGIVSCMDKGIDDLNIEFEAKGRVVSVIGPRAFQDCKSLYRVVLPRQLKVIGEMAFAGCNRLAQLTLPGSIVKTGALAFARCQSLARVRIDPGLTQLGPSCFQKCQNLTRVDIPMSVESFGGGVFFGCSRQLCLYGPAGAPAENYAKVNGIAYDTEDWKQDAQLILQENPDRTLTVKGPRDPYMKRIEIPRELCGRQITAIADRAFYGDTALEQILVSNGVRYVGNSAFMGCRNLSLAVFDYGPERIGESAFAGCEQLRQMILPSGTGSVGRLAFFGCRNLSFVRMPAVTRVEAMAFEGCAPELRIMGGVLM